MSDEQAKRVFRELQALARADYGGNTGALLVAVRLSSAKPRRIRPN